MIFVEIFALYILLQTHITQPHRRASSKQENRTMWLSKSISMFLFLISLHFTACVTVISNDLQGSMLTDRLALLDIKSKILKDQQGFLKSWNDSIRHCKWPGITCGRQHARVTTLDLSSKGLVGVLSPAIGNLSFLREINMYNNSLYGQIPQQVSKLSQLNSLILAINSFVGEIPSNLSHCTQLEALYLSNNKLVGSIPVDFHSMTQLRDLALDYNSLRGDLHYLGNLTSLQVLHLEFNAFGGRIPDTIGRIKGLSELGLEANGFLGPIPSSLYNLSSLTQLSFGGGPIVGALPADIGLTLPLLESFVIINSSLSGTIPVTLSNLSNIQQLTLANNRFTGKISLSGRNLPSLQLIELPQNQLGSGEQDDMHFLETFTNNSQFVEINLYQNQLAGNLPSSLANLSSLQQLVLSRNQLSGSISSFLDKLLNLQVLDLSENNFTGNIPDSIGKLNMLSRVSLWSNKFSGYIPTTIGNLSQVFDIWLHRNELEGGIPSSLGSCQGLQYLDLSWNYLTGEIPIQLFHATSLSVALYLKSNQLQGSLPTEIGQLKGLSMLDISDNRFSGELPEGLGQCISLTQLFLEDNLFSGRIPLALSSLKGLLILDLSQNKLSGQIPTYLSGLSLSSLNLSFNHFEGSVPLHGIFANTSAVSLVGNKGLCGGIKMLNLPKCPEKLNSRGKRWHIAVILAVAASCLLIGSAIAIVLFWFHVKIKRQNISQESLHEISSERISYRMLLKATDGFSPRNLIGAGSFGSVYKGTLDLMGSKIHIAAKVLNLQYHRGARSFIRECNALRNIRHRNLVKLISCCSSIDFQGNEFKALVYDLMPNGSLESWLHSNQMLEYGEQFEHGNKSQNLSLLHRLNIAIDVACALDYLHSGCDIQVFHCDLKPSNILLDNDMVAHVGDFGLARLHPELIDQSQSSSVGIKGTIGYAAPEYGIGNQLSASGDVYSYGIMLLEMLTGKRPSDQIFQNGFSLHDHAKKANRENITEIIDHGLLDRETEETLTDQDHENPIVQCLLLAVKIGVKCSMELPLERMSIRDAIEALKLARNILLSNHG